MRLPGVAGKAIAVIGMRRTGKATFLWQVLADRLAGGRARESLLHFSFENKRLGGMTVADLSLVVEEYYLLHPQLRDRQSAVFFLDEIQVHKFPTCVRRKASKWISSRATGGRRTGFSGIATPKPCALTRARLAAEARRQVFAMVEVTRYTKISDCST